MEFDSGLGPFGEFLFAPPPHPAPSLGVAPDPFSHGRGGVGYDPSRPDMPEAEPDTSALRFSKVLSGSSDRVFSLDWQAMLSIFDSMLPLEREKLSLETSRSRDREEERGEGEGRPGEAMMEDSHKAKSEDHGHDASTFNFDHVASSAESGIKFISAALIFPLAAVMSLPTSLVSSLVHSSQTSSVHTGVDDN